MRFRTEIEIAHSPKEITYQDKILLLGSCFSEHIAQKLREACFQVNSNPFGVLYNPLSIAQCIQVLSADTQENIPEEQIAQHNGLWHSLWHHGDFSKADRQVFDAGIAQSIREGRKALREADKIIVTFGTAWVYEYHNKVVANCHKLPERNFIRRRLNISEIVTAWKPIVALLGSANKDIVFTVSPIRHLKDGLHENQLSKSTLLLATDELVKNGQADYFPSYEIMTDELRDYRFYAEDMLHPSPIATEYIWERFCETCFSASTQQEMRPLQQLCKDFAHKPLHTDSEEWKKFAETRKQRLDELSKSHPWIRGRFGDLKI